MASIAIEVGIETASAVVVEVVDTAVADTVAAIVEELVVDAVIPAESAAVADAIGADAAEIVVQYLNFWGDAAVLSDGWLEAETEADYFVLNELGLGPGLGPGLVGLGIGNEMLFRAPNDLSDDEKDISQAAYTALKVISSDACKSVRDELTGESKPQIKGLITDALNSAKTETKSYLDGQKKTILKTSLIPFYGWVKAPIMLSHLEGDCKAYFKTAAGTNVKNALDKWKPIQELMVSDGLKRYEYSKAFKDSVEKWKTQYIHKVDEIQKRQTKEPEPIITINDGDEFFYSPWGGRCIASYVNGVLIMNRVGSEGIKTWKCKNTDETRTLLWGSTVGIEWSNKGTVLSTTATDNDTLKVMHGNTAYYFKRMMPLPSGSVFNYIWGKCLVSYDSSGKLYVALEGESRTVTDYEFNTRNSHDTDMLRAGDGVMVNWGNKMKYNIKITMTNSNTLEAMIQNTPYYFTKQMTKLS